MKLFCSVSSKESDKPIIVYNSCKMYGLTVHILLDYTVTLISLGQCNQWTVAHGYWLTVSGRPYIFPSFHFIKDYFSESMIAQPEESHWRVRQQFMQFNDHLYPSTWRKNFKSKSQQSLNCPNICTFDLHNMVCWWLLKALLFPFGVYSFAIQVADHLFSTV